MRKSGKAGLPGADELFRPTNAASSEAEPEARRAEPVAEVQTASPRVRHDEKITVYVSTDELLALETARLDLKAKHNIRVDRGRLVREAIAMALEELNAAGDGSELVQRLQ